MTTNSANIRASARFFALLPCAGQGSRAAAVGGLAKQYQVIAGQAMVLHTLAAFEAAERLSSTLVVVAPGDDFFDALPGRPFEVADCGGASRAESVRSGLAVLLASGAQPGDWVLVHDAARCLVTPGQIKRLMDACEHDAVGGLLAHKLPDTLKCGADGRVCGTLDRSDKWLAQTPQMFRYALLARALREVTEVTDEASAIEAIGYTPLLVEGHVCNLKVTRPADIALAELFMTAI